MKLFIKIGASILIATVILLLLQSFVSIGLTHNRNFKTAFIARQPINADIIANGACEIEMMLDPSIIKKYVKSDVYNLALNHADFADNYLHLREYLKHQEKPELVLLFAIPEGFDAKVTNAFHSYKFAHLMNDAEVNGVVKEMDPAYQQYSQVPFLKYSYYSNFIFYKSLSGWLDKFTGNKTPQWLAGFSAPVFPWHQSSYVLGKENRTPIVFNWSESRVKYFVKTLQLLKEQSIPVIVYHSPMYYEAEQLQKNRQEMFLKIDSLCNQFGVPYYRFDTLPMRYDRKNYYVSINPTIPTYNNTLAGISVFNNYFGRFLQDSLPSILGQENRQQSSQKKSNTVIINKSK